MKLTSWTGPGAGQFHGVPAPVCQDRAWDPVSSASVFQPMLHHEPLRGSTLPDLDHWHMSGPGTRCTLYRWGPWMAKALGSGSSRALHRSFPHQGNAGYAVPCISFHIVWAVTGFRNCGCRKSSDLRQEKNPSGFFDLYSSPNDSCTAKCRKPSACRSLSTCTTATRTMHHHRDKIDIFYKVDR
jgi:hypothetical protein